MQNSLPAPRFARWTQRWRARIVTRAGEHADLASPLAAKLAAGAIAFTVVGGAVATSRSPQQVTPTAPPSLVVQPVQPVTANSSLVCLWVPVARVGLC